MDRRMRLFAAALVAVFLLHALYLSGIAEDAFISFRYARNWVNGAGLVWNPGEAPVEGYTNFLWVALAAGMLALGFDPLVGSQLLGIGASLVTLGYTWRAGRLLGWSPAAALLPCACLALAGPFAAWATAGLETNAFGALILVGVYHGARYAVSARRADLHAAAAALLLASLTRPEGALVAGVVLAHVAVSSRAQPRRAARDLAGPLLISGALFGAYNLWRWRTFGQLLPNTFYAKTGGGAAQLARGAHYVGLFLAHYGLPWLPLLALSAAAARAGREAARWGAEPGAPALLPLAGAVVTAWAVYVVAVGGDYMAMYRFIAPVLALVYLLLAAAARPLLAALGSGAAARRAAAAAALACAALGTAVHSTPLERTLFPAPARMHGNWRGIQAERWHVRRLALIGRFFRDYAAGPPESVATDAIGALSWYSGLRVYDSHGLVDPAIAHEARAGANVGSGWAGHDRVDWVLAVSHQPTYVMWSRDLHPRRVTTVGLPPELAGLARDYRVVSVWLEDRENGEAGWFTFLERRKRAVRAAARGEP